MAETPYDALLFVSFGGPERREDVMPFLENVLRGKKVPRERLLDVAEHYYHFGGVSPINEQNRQLIQAVSERLVERGTSIPIYWGNRNWDPLLTETMQQMTDAGVRRALAFITAAHDCYSSHQQYLENIEDARTAAGPNAPRVDKLPFFYNHPDFIAAFADRVKGAIDLLPAEFRETCPVAFTAHSIPVSMASVCDYEQQLLESCRLVAAEAGIASDRWKLVYQSRSGRPQDPWLEPDILEHLRDIASRGAQAVALVPIGFISDHMEVLFDLDVEARSDCKAWDLPMVRASTPGTHPKFVDMICQLVEDRLQARG